MSYQKVNDKLLIRPRANLEESFQSYLIRLARANGYKYTAFSSAITAKSKPHRSFKPVDRSDIQNLISKIADTNVINLVDVWECGYYFKHLFDYSRIKVCPKCYENKQALPPYWWLKNYLVCVEHNQLLVDSCSKCNTRFNEESFVNGHCLECGLEIINNKSSKLNSGVFDKKLHDMFFNVSVNLSQFRELISNEVENIYVHYQVCSYLLKQTQSKVKYTNHRRTLDIHELYSEQKDAQQIMQEGKLRQLIYDSLSAYRIKSGKGMSSFIAPIFKSIMSPHSSVYKTELIKILIEEPKDLADWSVGINWVEKLLYVEVDVLKEFVKERFPEMEAKSQGPFAVLIRDLNFLMVEFSKHSPNLNLL